MPKAMNAVFNSEEEEHLIELVSENPPLYNPELELYRNKGARDEIWDQIGLKLNKPARRCRERWRRIRDNYRRAVKLRAGKSAYAAERIKTPKYNKILSVLKPFIELETEPISSYQNESGDDNTEFMSHFDLSGSPPTTRNALIFTDDNIKKEKLESPSQSFDPEPESGTTVYSFKIEPGDENGDASRSKTTNAALHFTGHNGKRKTMSSFDRELETETISLIKIESDDENGKLASIPQSEPPSSSRTTKATSNLTGHSKRKRRRKMETASSSFAVNPYLDNMMCQRTKCDPNVDFFTSLGKTVAEFPKRLQIKVKREVFKIVIAAEEEACRINAAEASATCFEELPMSNSN